MQHSRNDDVNAFKRQCIQIDEPYGFDYEDMDHLYNGLMGMDYLDYYMESWKNMGDSGEVGYGAVHETFLSCVGAQETGCGREFMHCANTAHAQEGGYDQWMDEQAVSKTHDYSN